MTEVYTDEKWNTFENTGRVSDYLAYKGIGVKSFSEVKGELADADDNRGCGHITERCGRQ
ncbi:MAG: hypothetical protein ACI4JJ_04235 [Huintestinicola sp.]